MKKKEEPENHLNNIKSKWFAVYTNYKREKSVAKELEKKGIECYLPIQKILRQWERKKRLVELPLINCYVFVKIKKEAYVPVLETNNVLRFVKFSNNLISIPEAEIDLLKRILLEGKTIVTDEIAYTKGDEVEIVSGNLAGLKGKLVKKQGKQNFLIELHTIGYAFQMEVDSSLLRKISITQTESIF